MKNVLVLGAGLVVRPLVRYLLDLGWSVTVASRTLARAEALTGKHPRARALERKVRTGEDVADLVGAHDLTVSLLPAPMHPVVAEVCIARGKPMVTTSYVSPAMRGLDAAAKKAGIVLLNELGLDPGIDHMSAMKTIHEAKAAGARVVGFQSYCGGLPAPEANDNPFGYKFSWSPRGVLTAAKNAARYLKDGREVNVPGPDLFTHYKTIDVEGAGAFEGYPNRDSVAYREVYGLEHAETVLRGTLRNLGWCDSWKKYVDLGLLDETPRQDLAGLTYAGLVRSLLPGGGKGAASDLGAALAAHFGPPAGAPAVEKLRWLGLLDEEKIAVREGGNLDILAARMWERMQYREGERDMIVLQHTFDVVHDGGRKERIFSTLVDHGQPGGDSAMSRTVALPAAIGVRMILDGRWTRPGVASPVEPAMYEPILAELGGLGVKFDEKRL